MIAGPYRSGSADERVWAENLTVLNDAALRVFEKGHMPIIGVNLVLPMIAVAGEALYEHLMMPLSLQLIERCDACLRVGGPSAGADREVEAFMRAQKPVYTRFEDIP